VSFSCHPICSLGNFNFRRTTGNIVKWNEGKLYIVTLIVASKHTQELVEVIEEQEETWNPSLTVSSCRMGSRDGRCHLSGSQRMVLLKAKPDISTWNLLSLLLFSFVCQPMTFSPSHTGPSSTVLDLLCASIPTSHVPNRLWKKITLMSFKKSPYSWLRKQIKVKASPF